MTSETPVAGWPAAAWGGTTVHVSVRLVKDLLICPQYPSLSSRPPLHQMAEFMCQYGPQLCRRKAILQSRRQEQDGPPQRGGVLTRLSHVGHANDTGRTAGAPR